MINISAPKTNSLDFEVPVFEDGVWKVREQLYPENRGYKVHKFECRMEAWAFYESK